MSGDKQTIATRDEAVIERKMRDIDTDLYLEIREYPRAELMTERKAVLGKLDYILMPLICMTGTIQFLDKLSLNYASAYSLVTDLDLTGQRFSWVVAAFNFGYLFWALPSTLLLQRLPIAKYTGAMLLTWCVILCCHAAVKSYASILALRFLLGMLEASIVPAIMSIASMFYTRPEQPLRICIFLAFNGFATMVGALLSYGLGHATSATIKPWQLIFLVIGSLNFVWAWVFLWMMPDSPSNARFLTRKQRIVAIDRIASNMIGVKTRQYQPRQSLEAVLDFKVHCLVLLGLGCGIVNGGVVNFASTLIKGYGFSGINTTLLQLPTGAFEFFGVILCGSVMGKLKNSRCIIFVIGCLPPLCGLVGLRLIDRIPNHKWNLLGCTWLQSLIGVPVAVAWNLLQTNIAGHTKRSVATGLWFLFFSGGNIVGAQLFFAREKPKYFSALTGFICCYCGVIFLSLALRQWMWWENTKRDKMFGVASYEDKAADEGFQDMTDKENKYFRYAL